MTQIVTDLDNGTLLAPRVKILIISVIPSITYFIVSVHYQ